MGARLNTVRGGESRVSCITSGSPAWKPQAMLAEVATASISASSPRR